MGRVYYSCKMGMCHIAVDFQYDLLYNYEQIMTKKEVTH